MGNNIDIPPHAFLAEVFHHSLRDPDEAVLVSWPARFTNSSGIVVDYYHQRGWHPRATALFPEGKGWTYCVSTVQRKRRLQRRKDDVRRAFILPCDDVGTKASAPPVEPSYILETSPDNFQYGYLIDPFDVSDGKGFAYYDACLVALARAGFNDFGCRSATRVIKLPGATHVSGFTSQLTQWTPERCWALPELMALMGVDPALDVRRATARRGAGRHTQLEEVCDPVYDWLCTAGLVTGVREEWVHIKCPWSDLHSAGKGQDAGYSPLDYVKAGRAFNCFHGHGREHGMQQFLAWVVAQGGPATDISYNRIRNILNVHG